jgi:hypothetical protein
MFFSEEKNQKTFMSCASPTLRPYPGSIRAPQKQKSFGSFLQKRTVLPFALADLERR